MHFFHVVLEGNLSYQFQDLPPSFDEYSLKQWCTYLAPSQLCKMRLQFFANHWIDGHEAKHTGFANTAFGVVITLDVRHQLYENQKHFSFSFRNSKDEWDGYMAFPPSQRRYIKYNPPQNCCTTVHICLCFLKRSIEYLLHHCKQALLQFKSKSDKRFTDTYICNTSNTHIYGWVTGFVYLLVLFWCMMI